MPAFDRLPFGPQRWLRALALSIVPLAPVAVGLNLSTTSEVHASSAPTIAFTLSGVRPEALSWLWDNLDEGLFTRAHPDNLAFQWTHAPATPEHLGYSAAARYLARVRWQGTEHTLDVAHLPYQTVRDRVPSDNYLGAKPYSFAALGVRVDGGAVVQVLVHYEATGASAEHCAVRIEALNPQDAPAAAHAVIQVIGRTLQGLQPTVMNELDQRYFNQVFLQRGSYQIGALSKQLTKRLTVVQEIKGITPDMLAWWWDHIGNTARYKLWQPIDHLSFSWRVPPTQPDMQYDIGAVQRVRETIGRSAWSLDITGADPALRPPPVPLTAGEGYFYALANPPWVGGLLPPNGLLHSWRPTPRGDGVVLTSTFENTALVQLLSRTFFDDLGRHALREFQMLPYFLPRLYRREHLGE